jgi:hypothetical protein
MMSAFEKSTWTETQFGADPTYATYVSLRPLATDPGTIEIRFETTFAKAKDPSYRQTKGQHFISKADLQLLRDQINGLLSGENLSKLLPASRGSK